MDGKKQMLSRHKKEFNLQCIISIMKFMITGAILYLAFICAFITMAQMYFLMSVPIHKQSSKLYYKPKQTHAHFLPRVAFSTTLFPVHVMEEASCYVYHAYHLCCAYTTSNPH